MLLVLGNSTAPLPLTETRKGEMKCMPMRKQAESVETDPDVLKLETDVSIALQVQFPEQCLETYVLVEYDGRPYPGYVEDVDADDLYVNCMYSIERKVSNSYVSPRLLKDRCWYSHDKVLAMIPEPTKTPKYSRSGHRKVH